jgi:hypothetical protein
MEDDRGHTPDSGEFRLTYGQLGARLGISSEAARQLTRRRGWRRIQPNRLGAPAIVVVPEEELGGELWRHERETTPDAPRPAPDVPLQLYGDDERARADQAEQRAVRAEQRADEAVQLAKTALARADRAEERTEEANRRANAADADRRIAESRAEKAEATLEAERQRADTLRATVDELKAGQSLMTDMHTKELDGLRKQHQAVQQAADELRQAEATRKARGRLRRAWDGWRGR